MTRESELTLRKALDAVDRNRRNLYAVFVVLFLALVGFLVWLAFTPNIREMLLHSVVIMVFTVVQGVVVLAIYINRMARMLLRAIELASKP